MAYSVGNWQATLNIKDGHGYSKGIHSFEPEFLKPETLKESQHGQLLVEC